MSPPDGSRKPGPGAFFQTITEAVREFTERGFVSQAHLEEWMERVRRAAQASLVPESQVEAEISRILRATYQREIGAGAILKHHPGVGQFTLQKVKPRLHAELDRRIMANAQLIRLNRVRAIDTTVQRLAGWATSIPPGGTRAGNPVNTKQDIRKALAQLPFEERRVAIDQGHKFISALSDIIAKDAGALAMQWHSKWRQRGYDYREPHKERDKLIYAIRGNWAIGRGLMKAGPNGYLDEITQPGQEVFCGCSGLYVYSLDRLPDDMLTDKGRAEMSRVQAMVA